MQHPSRRNALTLFGGLALASPALVGRARAEDTSWPQRVVTLVVGFPPGSINDVMARALSQALSPILGQPVVVENKGGAGGTIGTRAVARAEPDGYTLMLGTSSQLVMNVAAYAKLDFSIEHDLIPVALLSRSPLLLVVNTSVPVKNLAELIALAKEKPGTLNYGTNGIGGIVHVSTERFLGDAKIKMQPVHYRGSGPALQGVVSGEVQVLIDGPLTAGSFVTSGDLKALAVAPDRVSALPDVPTYKEQGLMNSDGYTWNSIMVPKGTPQPIIDKLNAAINKALDGDQMQSLIAKAGSTSLKGSTPASTDAFWRNELKIWVPVVQSLDIKLD
jgi:tripartite-type tricarboxylate transporter receptor subunit TctC